MKSFVGIGKGCEPDALKQATQGIGRPTGIIFVSTFDQLKPVTDALAEMFPGVQVMGTSGTSIANGSVSDSQLIVVGFYEDAKVSFGVIENISTCPIIQVKKLENSLSEVGASKENTVCYEFCTGSEEKLVVTLQAVLQKKNISLVGGTVFGVPEGKVSTVSCNGKLYEDACVYAVIKNTTGKVMVYKENIYQKMPGAEGHYATKVNTAKRALYDLHECSAELTDAIDKAKNELHTTHEQAENTDSILENIDNSVKGIENVQEVLKAEISECSQKAAGLSAEIARHEQEYARVMEDLESMKGQMTNKGFIYEDISMLLEQTTPIIDLLK